MAFCRGINSYTRNHLNSSLYRHLGKRSVAIWRTFPPTCSTRFDSRQGSLTASCVVLSKHISTWNKQSLPYPCQGQRKGVFNVNKFGLHCTRTSLQEKAVSVTQQIEDVVDKDIETQQESTKNVSSCQNSPDKKAGNENSLTSESLQTNSNELSECSTMEKGHLITGTSSNIDSPSQTSVPLTADMLDEFLISFFEDSQVKKAAHENGLKGYLFNKIFQEFRKKILLQVKKGNTEMLNVFSSSYYESDYMLHLFPLFLTFAQKVHPMLKCFDAVKQISDLRGPADLFPEARAIKRKIIYHAGPTNSGKTHAAIERYHAAHSGVYCGPLRLLATEVFRRSNNAGVPCDLVTGEDRQWAVSPDHPSDHVSCTVEMCSTGRPFDCAVIDEIQMMKDTDRGWAWSRALLGLPCPEIHVCGESSAINLVERLVSSCNDELEVRHYERLCPLEISKRSLGGNFDNIRRGDCIVAFSQWDLYRIRRQIERQTNLKCAIIYGGLPPVTKLEQAIKFNDLSDECSVLVASDAIGMGLNLNIKRIVFSTLMKFDGNDMVQLTSSQAKQIAGRAGRYGSAHSKGEATTLKTQDSKILQRLMNQPIEDVKAAGLSPSMEQIEMLAQQLPDASIPKLYETFESVVQLDGANFFMCDLEEKKTIARKLRGIPLSISDQYVFSTAPISLKKPLTIDLAIKFAEAVSQDSAMTSSKLQTFLKWPPRVPMMLTQLQNLEVLHEGLDLYLWLSYRFPHIFVDQENVCTMQDEVEAIIRDTVSSSTFGAVSTFTRQRRQRHKRRFSDKEIIKCLDYHKF